MENLTEKELLEIQGGGLIKDLVKAVINAGVEIVGDAIRDLAGPNV